MKENILKRLQKYNMGGMPTMPTQLMPQMNTPGPTGPAYPTLDAGIIGAGVSYLWSTGETTQTLYVSESGTYGVTVSASGCAAVSDEVVITSLAPTTINDTICEAGDVILSVVDNGGSYVWYSDAALTAVVGNGSSFATGQSAAGVYTYYATQNIGCESTASTVTLEIYALPITGPINHW